MNHAGGTGLQRGLALLTLLSVTAACGEFSPLPPNSPIIQGVLQWEDHPFDLPDSILRASVEFPDTVRAGVAFTARVLTIGPNICWFADDAAVSQQGNRIQVVPWDRGGVPGQLCTPAFRTLQRFARLTFPETGEGVVVLAGRKVRGPDPAAESVLGEPHQLEFRVEVR
jgi:hypothetical protein